MPTRPAPLAEPAGNCAVGNGLALAAQSLDLPFSQRWQYLTALYLQQPLAEVQQQSATRGDGARSHDARPVAPALSLIWPWDVQRDHHGLLPAPYRRVPGDLAQALHQCS